MVKTWFDGGAEASGTIQPAGAIMHQFTGKGVRHLEDLSGRYSQGRESSRGVDFLCNADGGGSEHLLLIAAILKS